MKFVFLSVDVDEALKELGSRGDLCVLVHSNDPRGFSLVCPQCLGIILWAGEWTSCI